MRALLFTGLSGWLLLALVAATAMLPYMLRGGAASLARGARPFPRDLRPHYWLGYAAALLSFAHAWVPMSAGWAGRLNAAGMYSATGGWLLIYLQTVLGQSLREARRGRAVLRRCHFWIMVGIVALVLVHIALNSMTVRALF